MRQLGEEREGQIGEVERQAGPPSTPHGMPAWGWDTAAPEGSQCHTQMPRQDLDPACLAANTLVVDLPQLQLNSKHLGGRGEGGRSDGSTGAVCPKFCLTPETRPPSDPLS